MSSMNLFPPVGKKIMELTIKQVPPLQVGFLKSGQRKTMIKDSFSSSVLIIEVLYYCSDG